MQPNQRELNSANCLLAYRRSQFDQADNPEKGFFVPVFWVDDEGTCHNSMLSDRGPLS